MYTLEVDAPSHTYVVEGVVVGNCQDADSFTVEKSIRPMMAAYNGTSVLSGTPNRTKNVFYRAIQRNKRRQTRRAAKINHFEVDWREAAKYNDNYGKFIRKEIIRLGEDSDEFQLSYALRWLLDRGMFVTDRVMEECGDKGMDIVKSWWTTPVLVGVDPARAVDSTVVTVVWVDWDHPDEFGYYDHRILNWLEIVGDDWEEQYFQIIDFLAAYNVWGVGVDSQGVGDAVASRLAVLMPRSEVIPIGSGSKTQSERWKHLMELLQRRKVGWPAHARARRLKKWQRFYQQMTDLEKKFQGPYMLAEAPDETDAHDDYPDSLALACSLTRDLIIPEVVETVNPMYQRSR